MRPSLGTLLAGLLAVLLASCRATGREASTLTILVQGDEHILSLSWDVPPKFLVFLPLVAKNADGELEGVLATRWEHSPDYREWTVRLRSDVKWHDGVPFTAHDVKFTLDLLAHPEVLWAAPGAYDVTVLDDTSYTIVYHAKGPGNPLDDWTVFYPRHLLERLDPATFAEWEFWLAPVGNGPYRYVRRVPQTMMEFAANPDFYRGTPSIDRLVLKFGPPQITELLSGAVDVVSYVNAADVLKVRDDPRFEAYYALELMNGDVILWNQRRPPFDDARVRRALTHAVNRRELHHVLNFPDETPIVDGKFTERQYRRGELPAPLAYDPALAERLLAETAWRDGPRQFTALVPPMFQLERAAVYVQEQLRRVGVRMEIEQGTLGVLGPRIRTGDFDAVFLRMPLSGEWSALRFFEAGSPIGYEKAEVIALLEEIRSVPDPDAQDRAHRALTDIFRRDVPATHLAPGVGFMLSNRRVRGLSSPFRAYPFAHPDELSLTSQRR